MAGRDFTSDDLARFLALEHMLTVIYSAHLAGRADATQTPAGQTAREFSDALHGSIVDGALPPEIRKLMRTHVDRVFGQVKVNRCAWSQRSPDP